MSGPGTARDVDNRSMYEVMSRDDLINTLLNRDSEIKSIALKFEQYIHNSNHQLTEIVHRFGDLKKAYDEQSISLLNTLWIHCAQNHPELANIPMLEYDNAIVESDTHIGNFIFGEFLGEGAFAAVKSCAAVGPGNDYDSHPKHYDLAAKIIDKYKIKNFTTLKRLSDEIGVLKKLNSPFVIGFKDVIHTPKLLYIITDRGGQDMFEFLHQYRGAVDQNLAREITVGLLHAVSYIHDQGICHRDLKPENILLSFPNGLPTQGQPLRRLDSPSFTQGQVIVKICDFGVCSKFRRKIMLQDFCGSAGFFAPEMLLQGYYFGDKADLWSIGCILLELALGHRRFCLYWMRAYSFDVIQEKEAFRKRITTTVNSVLSSEMLRVDPEYEEFLVQFLRLLPSERPSFKRISQFSWLRGMFKFYSSQSDNSKDPDSRDELADLTNFGPRYNTMAPSQLTVDANSFGIPTNGGMSPNTYIPGPIASPVMMSGSNTTMVKNNKGSGFNSDLISSLFDHLSELTADFAPQVEEYNKTMDDNMASDATGGNEGNDMETFRLPPQTNWKNLLHTEPGRFYPDDNSKWNQGYGSKAEPLEKSKVRVLLVEDSAFQRKLMAKRIQMVGLVNGGPDQWEVVQCSDGESALTMVDESKEQFDVIVVDQNLASDPNRLEGHEVVQYCRAKYPDAVIIGCTANAPKHSKSLLVAGADLVWAKPLPREDVIFANVNTMMRIRRPQLSPDQVLRHRMPTNMNMEQMRQMQQQQSYHPLQPLPPTQQVLPETSLPDPRRSPG